MKRPRPTIPLSVRVQVAERQVEHGLWWPLYRSAVEAGLPMGKRLQALLQHLPKGAQLDHDPALILRPFNPRSGKYTPDANDPEFLIYREPREHLEKTIGRKRDAEKTVTTKGSDQWLKAKFNRLEGRTKKRPKQKIPQRANPWPRRKLRAVK